MTVLETSQAFNKSEIDISHWEKYKNTNALSQGSVGNYIGSCIGIVIFFTNHTVSVFHHQIKSNKNHQLRPHLAKTFFANALEIVSQAGENRILLQAYSKEDIVSFLQIVFLCVLYFVSGCFKHYMGLASYLFSQISAIVRAWRDSTATAVIQPRAITRPLCSVFVAHSVRKLLLQSRHSRLPHWNRLNYILLHAHGVIQKGHYKTML